MRKENLFNEELGYIQTLSAIYASLQTNEISKEFATHQEFVDILKETLKSFVMALDKKDILSLQARACLILINKVVDDSEIFQYLNSTKKKVLPKKNAPKAQSKQKTSSLDDREEEKDSYISQSDEEKNQQNGESDFEINLDESSLAYAPSRSLRSKPTL